MTSDDVLREWDHHAQDLGWLAWGLINRGDPERAYAAAYCAAHYAACILRWREMQAGRPACPECRDHFDLITCSDYETLPDGAALARVGD